MYKYIINPLNKKKINVKSKLGKKILQNYLNLQIGSSHGLGVTSKSKDEKKVDLPSLEKIDEDEAIATLTQSQKLCPIKGNHFCKNITPGFNSHFNILNYISHNEDGELNDINFDKTLYKRVKRKYTGKSGRYGGIVDNIFENENTKNQIRISEKILKKDPDNPSRSLLEEIKFLRKHPNLIELCPHIVPIKILDDKIYMLRGNGDLTKLIEKIDVGAAHQIVNCIKKTLLCLLEQDIYYFDLKPDNVIYQCIDNTMYIWLVDVGSMLADKYGDYIATYPHPIINCLSTTTYHAGLIIETVYGANLSRTKSHERIKDIYAYQLSQLFFNLLGLNEYFDYEYITDNKYAKIIFKEDLQYVIDQIEGRSYKYRLIKNYVGVFKEIINGIKEMESGREFPIPCHEDFWQ